MLSFGVEAADGPDKVLVASGVATPTANQISIGMTLPKSPDHYLVRMKSVDGGNHTTYWLEDQSTIGTSEIASPVAWEVHEVRKGKVIHLHPVPAAGTNNLSAGEELGKDSEYFLNVVGRLIAVIGGYGWRGYIQKHPSDNTKYVLELLNSGGGYTGGSDARVQIWSK